MGNSLCKEPNVNSSLRPGRVLDNFGSLVCPNGLGKSKPGINKTYLSRHVLETGPKAHTIDNSWRSATLTVPAGEKVIDRPPVAPPRKKRTTLPRGTSVDHLKVKNGFKDVFGPDSRRQSYDVQAKPSKDTVDEGLQGKSLSCYEIDAKNDAFSDFCKVPTKAELEKPKADGSQSNTTKVPKVGNKKSDKFFGESLSDSLSNEPVVMERRRSAKKGMEDLDKIDQFIEKNIPKVEVTGSSELITSSADNSKIDESQKKMSDALPTKSENDALKQEHLEQESLIKYVDETMGKDTSLGKKAEFLMAMLEDYPEDRYLGMVPVEEPVIVPRKRKSRHICDDDKHIHEILHKHEKENESSKKLITTEASIETPPRKPSRDFSRYLATMDGCSDSDDSNFARPVRKIRSPTRRGLPSPPSPPKLPKSLSEAQFRYSVNEAATSTPKKDDSSEDQKAHTPRMLKRIISMPSTSQLVKPDSRSTTPLPALLKSSSSSSFLIKDLQKAHISVGSFTPEDTVNTADELVKPKSRLTTRKISVKSNECVSVTPTSEKMPPKFTIGSSEVIRTVVIAPSVDDSVPPAIPKRRKSSGVEQKRETPKLGPVPKEILGYDLGAFLQSSQILHHHDITNVIENVYNASDGEENIIKEFQKFLEHEINSELNDPKMPNTVKLLEVLSKQVEDEDTLDDIKIDLVESEIPNHLSDMDDCFDPEFDKIELHDTHRQIAEDGGDWCGSGSDVGSVIEGSDKLGFIVTMKSNTPRVGRRESIEDVDSWFRNHNDWMHGEPEIIGVRRQRRGSDGLVTYDTSRQYPFGELSNRRDSLSADLFEDITKLQEMGIKKCPKVSPLQRVKNSRRQERRGSDGLIFYDTSRKFPFGEPNTDLPKALAEESSRKVDTNNTTAVTAQHTSTNSVTETDSPDLNEQRTDKNSDHSTLLKFLSKENLIE